jgi:hypothetical protein
MSQPLQRVPVAPANHKETYAPNVLRCHPEEALDRLLEMKPEDCRRAILSTVDPILLDELSSLLLNADFLISKALGSAAALLREMVVQQKLITTRRRAAVVIVEPRKKSEEDEEEDEEKKKKREVTREEGERNQLAAEEHPSLIKRMTEPELERRFHAKKLWELCAVRYQEEMIAFPQVADDAERQLPAMIEARAEAKYLDGFTLLREGTEQKKDGTTIERRGFDEVPVHLISAGRKLAGSGIFGVVGTASAPLVLSCVHELRFYGHGKAGGEGREASFKFADNETFTTALRDPHRIMRFRAVRNMMAPGASILLEGCETGRGAAGKAFLKALAELCFGSEKWGFVRANTEEITGSVIPKTGLDPGDPVTLKWPDDF